MLERLFRSKEVDVDDFILDLLMLLRSGVVEDLIEEEEEENKRLDGNKGCCGCGCSNTEEEGKVMA